MGAKGETGDWSWGGAVGPGWELEGGETRGGADGRVGVGGGARARGGDQERSPLSHTHPQPPLMHAHSYTRVHLLHTHVYMPTQPLTPHTCLCTLNHTCPHVLAYTCVQSHTCWHTYDMLIQCTPHIHSPHLHVYSHMPTQNPSGTLTTLTYTRSHTQSPPPCTHLSNTYIRIMHSHSHMLIHVHTLTHIRLTHIHTHTHTQAHLQGTHTHTHTDNLPHTPFSQATVGNVRGWEHEGSIRVGGVWGGGRWWRGYSVDRGTREKQGVGILQAFGRRPGLRDD